MSEYYFPFMQVSLFGARMGCIFKDVNCFELCHSLSGKLRFLIKFIYKLKQKNVYS